MLAALFIYAERNPKIKMFCKKKTHRHFDRSPDSSGRSGEIHSKTDFSTRLRLARNDILNSFLQSWSYCSDGSTFDFSSVFSVANLVVTLSANRLALCDSLCKFVQKCIHFRVGVLGPGYLRAGVHNGCVVTAAQMPANFFETVLG